MTASLTRQTAMPKTRQSAGVKYPLEIRPVTSRESFHDRGEWVTQARCREVDPDELFVQGAEQRKAVAICRHCPVVLQCRADALDNRVEFGVWGGMTERQRRALLRKHPEIESWANFFAGQLEAAAVRKTKSEESFDGSGAA